MRVPSDKVEGGYLYRAFIHCGAKYKDPLTGELKDFIGEDGRRYIGLLNETGGPLKIGEPINILWFAIREVYGCELLE
jgi:hypothetical protein